MAVVLGLAAWAWVEFGSIRLAWLHASGVRLRIEPSVLAVGPPAPGEGTTHLELTALNLTDRPVRLLGANANCSCLTAGGLPLTIPPRSRAILPVSMAREPENPSRVRVSLNYHTDHPNAPRLTIVVEER